eukprot:6126440-Amphidinium_carterae.1
MMVICGNRQPWEANERTSTNNLDASLLRWMLSTWAHRDTTWTTVDISTAFLHRVRMYEVLLMAEYQQS